MTKSKKCEGCDNEMPEGRALICYSCIKRGATFVKERGKVILKYAKTWSQQKSKEIWSYEGFRKVAEGLNENEQDKYFSRRKFMGFCLCGNIFIKQNVL